MDHLVFVEDLFAFKRIEGEERKTCVLCTTSLHSPEHERIHNPVSFLSHEARIHCSKSCYHGDKYQVARLLPL